MLETKVLDVPNSGEIYKAGATNGGHVYWVKEADAADYDLFYEKHFVLYGNGQSSVHNTIQSAINASSPNVGDVIYVCEGYTQTITTAAAIALSKAGVAVIGLGSGDSRPTITISSTDNAGTITQSGNGSVFKNFIIVTNDDGLTNAVVVTGDGCVTEITHKDTSSAVEAACIVRMDTANNSYLKLTHYGFTAGNAMVRGVAVDACSNVLIDIDAYGVVSTAWVNFVDAASTNVCVRGSMYTQGISNFSRDVVDTVGGSTWFAVIDDMSFGGRVSGGSASALASDDVSALAVSVAAIKAVTDLLPNAGALTGITTAVTTTIPNELLAHPRSVEKTDGAVLLGTDDLFTITGGPIKVLEIVGIVDTQIGAGATNVKLQITTDSPAATVDMNAGAVDIDADAVGTSYRSINTTAIFTPVTAGFVMEGNSFATQDTSFLCPTGTIKFNSDAARAGVIKWYLRYVPLSPLSRVVAAA